MFLAKGLKLGLQLTILVLDSFFWVKSPFFPLLLHLLLQMKAGVSTLAFSIFLQKAFLVQQDLAVVIHAVTPLQWASQEAAFENDSVTSFGQNAIEAWLFVGVLV